MKKLFFLFLCVCIAAVSCDRKNADGTDGPVIINPDDIIVDKNDVLDDEAQKLKLEQVATKLMDMFPADEYEDMMELSKVMYSHCDRYFTDEDYDWSDLEDAGEDIAETLYDEKQKGEYKWQYTYTLFLSNCTGIVTLDKNEARYEESDITKVIIKDVDGEDWEAVVTPKRLKKVFLGEFLETYYDYYEDIEYTDVYNVTVEIPASLSLEVKRNGRFFAEVEVKFDYEVSKDGVDIEKDQIGVEAEIKIDDLALTLKNASYDASTGKVEFSQSLRKGDYFIFSQSLKGKAELEYDEDEDGYVYIEDWDGEVEVELNVLGELQIKGTCRDLNKLSGYLEDEYDSEKDCEKAAERVTGLVDLGVYYDGTSTRQASVEFDPVVEDNGYGDEFYWIEPVLVFGDGSRYFFYDYFDDRIFEDLVEDFEDFIYDYEDMVEDVYE